MLAELIPVLADPDLDPRVCIQIFQRRAGIDPAVGDEYLAAMIYDGRNLRQIRSEINARITEKSLLAAHFAGAGAEHVADADHFAVGDYVTAPVNLPQTRARLILWRWPAFEASYEPTGWRMIEYD